MTVNLADQPLGLKILIVEDYADCATSMATLLRMYGHEITVTGNGAEALANFRQNRADVVLLDIGLPKMNGYEVAMQLKNSGNGHRPFIIAVTGFGQDEDRQRSAAAGIDVHLLKPLDPSLLESILHEYQQQLATGRSAQGSLSQK